MSLGDRLGIVGVIIGLIGIAAVYLWQDKKWIGWCSLICAGGLVIGWAVLEFKTLPASMVIGAIVGAGLAALIWNTVQSKPEDKNITVTAETHEQLLPPKETISTPQQPSPPISGKTLHEKAPMVTKKSNEVIDRSVTVGAGANVPGIISTGDNAKIEQRIGPPEPFVLTATQQQHMADELKQQPGETIALVCIGRGCQSSESVAAAFMLGTWNATRFTLGSSTSASNASTADLSVGVHLMENDGATTTPNEQKLLAIKAALKAAEITFDMSPWQPMGAVARSGVDLCLVIGNPK